MPDIKLDPGHPLHPDQFVDPDHPTDHIDVADDEDGDIIARRAQEDERPGVGLPAAGIAQEFGNERDRDLPD